MKVALITNIPTPYRVPLFNVLNRKLIERDFELRVLFGAFTYSRRYWSVDPEEMEFDHQILSSRTFSFNDPERTMFSYTKLLGALNQYQPDLVITTGFSLGTLKACWWCYLSSRPFITWSGTTRLRANRHGLTRRLERKALVKKADAFNARRNFFVPIPRFASWDLLNADLESQCRARRERRLRRHTETIGERFERDRQAFVPLPPVPYEACDTRTTRVTSLSLVRYRRNDYSVPTAYGHREVVVKGFVDDVVIGCGSEEIARHRRSYGREELIFEPRHYLALLERKIGALDQAAPLAGWVLPDEFLRLRRRLEVRLGKAGTREYVQVLRLLEDFRFNHVSGAIRDAREEPWLVRCVSHQLHGDVGPALDQLGGPVLYENWIGL